MFEKIINLLDSGKNVFLTGSAGTGKSYLTREIIAHYRHAYKNIVVLGSTGISAVNIGGVSIHSFFKFGISDKQRLEFKERVGKGEWSQDSARATIQANGKDYNGTFVFIDNVVDSNTASVDAKASFDNPKFELTPGIYTKVLVYGFHQKAGFEIPQVAIMQDLAGLFVYIVEDGKVAKRPIKIASQDAVTAVVSSGLKEGDVIITDNFKKITLGQPVQPVPAKAAQAKGDK